MKRLILALVLAVSSVGATHCAMADESGPQALAAGQCVAVGPCGDVNASGKVTSSDALAVLKEAVGQHTSLTCQCASSTPSTTSTTLPVREYVVNANGTITATATGLVWEKLSDDGSIHDQNNKYSWDSATSAKIATLNSSKFAGASDWRLPTLEELQSIVDFAEVLPSVDPVFDSFCDPGCKVTKCSCTYPDRYWSATPSNSYSGYAWYVEFLNGTSGQTFKTSGYYVRAVRGGS